jgi:hypothetical protein
VYTPEAVIDGKAQLVGSDRVDILGAIARAKRLADARSVRVTIARGKTVTVMVGGGAVLTEVNVVRSMTMLGPWNGAVRSYTVPPPAGAHFAVLVQRDDGSIAAAASD